MAYIATVLYFPLFMLVASSDILVVEFGDHVFIDKPELYCPGCGSGYFQDNGEKLVKIPGKIQARSTFAPFSPTSHKQGGGDSCLLKQGNEKSVWQR